MKRFLFPVVFALLLSASASAEPLYPWAQFVIGGGYRCRLMITNETTFPWKGTAIIRYGMDQPWDWHWTVNGQDFTGQSEFQIDLGPNETVSFIIDGDDVTRTGYLDIEIDYGSGSSTLNVVVSYFYEYLSHDGILLESVGSHPSQAGDDFLIPVERAENSDQLIDYGIAWCSIWDVPFEMVVILFDDQGNEVSRGTTEFSGQEARFLGEILQDIPSEITGYVEIISQQMIFVQALRFVQNKADGSYQLTSTSVDGMFK